MPEFTGVSHVELTVRDADRSATWYEQVLGLKRVQTLDEHTTPGVVARVINLIHPATLLSIGLIAHPSSSWKSSCCVRPPVTGMMRSHVGDVVRRTSTS